MGNKTTGNQSNLKLLRTKELEGTVIVSGGVRHSLALKKDGTVWTWGSYENTFDEFKDLKNLTHTTPTQIKDLANVVAIASGHMHGLALKNDGTVWAWGDGSKGSLGHGDFAISLEPVKVEGLEDVVAIASRHWHSLAVKKDGTLWAWGYNPSGQIDNSLKNLSTPVQIPGIPGTSPIAAIAPGAGFSSFLKEDGTVWSWGSNNYGQSGDWVWKNVGCYIDVKEGESIFGRCKIQIKDGLPAAAYCGIRFFSDDKPMEAKGSPLVGDYYQLTFQAPKGANRALIYVEMPCIGGVEATFSEIHFNRGVEFTTEADNLWSVPPADPNQPTTVTLSSERNNTTPVAAHELKL